MRDGAEWNVEGPWDFGEVRILCSREPVPDLLASFWPVYEESFGPLRVRAAARQVLTEDEFAAELEDPRVWKYVALDANGALAGLATLTDDITTMPWISPEYYQHHYPDEWNRRALFYGGLFLVRPDMRRYPVTSRMGTCVAQRVAAARGMVAYDMCGFNTGDRFLDRAAAQILNSVADFEVHAVDVQTYYVAKVTGKTARKDA